MNIFILNKKFESILLVEAYQSLIWNDRYNEAGDFELYLPASVYDRDAFQIGNYVCAALSDRLMIIEEIICETGLEEGDFLTISGRSLESILCRRVIGTQLDLSGNLQDAIEKLLQDHIISPTNEKRKIENFVFVRSTDERITSLTVEDQFEPEDTVYDVIKNITGIKRVGMRMLKNDLNQFTFELYFGTDRSYKQQTTPWVAFSPDLDNLLSSTYKESITSYKNHITVSGTYDIEPPEETETPEEGSEPEPEEQDKTKEIAIEIGESSGLDRFEFYVSASDIVSRTYDDDGNESYLTEEEFESRLITKGKEYLNNYRKEIDFETEVDPSHTFKINEDYFLGDILQVSNQYGISSSLRVDEYIISVSSSGVEYYPRFVNLYAEDQNEL